MDEIEVKKEESDNLSDEVLENNQEEFPFEELFEEFPEEAQKKVTKMVGMTMRLGGAMSPMNELAKKMTPENIETFLEGNKKMLEYDFQEGRDNKIFYGVVIIAVLIFIVVLIMLLKDNPALLQNILCTVSGLLVGLIGGYGYGKTKRDN